MEYLSLQDIPHRQYDSLLHSRRMASLQSTERYAQVDERLRDAFIPKTTTQYQPNDFRRTPPIQPGESSSGTPKLPSFSEFLQTTRPETPPRTPSRRNGSNNHSPREYPLFEDPAWHDPKRRRVDQRNDSLWQHPHHAHTAEPLPVDSRRLSTSIDPTLQRHNSPHGAAHPGSMQHHRTSLSYPPVHASASQGVHHRDQHSPGPQSHSGYRSTSGQANMSVHPTYSSPAPHGALYDHRHGYYDAAPAAHPGYGYAPTSQFARHSYNAPYPGYDGGYPDIRFQAHMGMNPDSSRKRRGNLPKDATNYMKDWYNKHKDSPYPTEDQKLDMCERTGLSISQVSNWFINARRRQPEKEKREQEAAAEAAAKIPQGGLADERH